jgi:hypothetical protein
MLSESYVAKTNKSNEPYTWDINGEDYWIINEDMPEQEENESDIRQVDSGASTVTRR